MTIEADILTMLADRAPRHRIDIISEMKQHNPGSVDATLSAMFKRGKLERVGSVYRLPKRETA